MMKSSTKLKSGVILATLVVLFLLVDLTGFSKNIRGFFYSFSSPVQKSLWQAGANVSDYFSGLLKTNEIVSENKKLSEQNQELLVQNTNLANLEQENQTMRNALGIGLNSQFRLLLVEVVGKEIDKDTLIINQGSQDGLSVGQTVITAQKVLVGSISEVYAKYSEVELITNPNISFGVEVASTTVLGEAQGEGSLKLGLGEVPQDQTINNGDVLVSTDLGGIFPDGLLVGQIENAQKNDTASFQTADIQPAFNINGLNNLFVIVGSL